MQAAAVRTMLPGRPTVQSYFPCTYCRNKTRFLTFNRINLPPFSSVDPSWNPHDPFVTAYTFIRCRQEWGFTPLTRIHLRAKQLLRTTSLTNFGTYPDPFMHALAMLTFLDTCV